MRVPGEQAKEKPKNDAPRSIRAEIGEAFNFVLNDPVFKPFMFVIVVLNFLFIGPMSVGTASLAKDRFNDVLALGIMGSAIGVGSLVGLVVGGTLHPRKFGVIVMSMIGVAGVCLALVGYAQTLPVVCVLFATMGG